MGTPDFSVPSLQALHEQGFDIAAVYSQPDKQRGRGKKVSFSPVKEKALEVGIPVLQPDTLRDEQVVAELAEFHPDVIIVIAYGKILPKAVLDIPKYGCLQAIIAQPKYRGAAPIQYAVKDGEAVSGVTIMLLDEGMDTGAILKKAEIKLDPKETTGSLFDKLSVLGAQARTYWPILKSMNKYLPQDESQAAYPSKIDKETAQIDWTQDAIVIERLIRTLDPHPGAYTWLDGKRLKVWSADVVDGADAEPGTIIAVTKKTFTVQTGSGALCVREVQPESRKRMQTAQFLQGISLQPGDVLTRE